MHDKPTVRATVYGLTTRDDAILLTRLSEQSPVFTPGLWHLPGGGIDPDEQPLDALGRELREEAGLDVREARLVDARSYRADRNGVAWQVLALFYAIALDQDRPTVSETDGASDAAAWIPLTTVTPDQLSPVAADGIRILAAGRPG